MAEVVKLAAELRERAGKGAAREARRQGRVPAVIYGNKFQPVMISVNPFDIRRELGKPGFWGRVFEIEAGGETYRVLPRDVQFDPLKDHPIHIDFLRFGADARVRVEVGVAFRNEEASPGIKRGGVLNIVRRKVELICSPDNIPSQLIVDLTGVDIGTSIHISAIKLPEGVVPAIGDRDFTVATIAAPSVMAEEAKAAAAAAAEAAGTEDAAGSTESA